MNPSPGTLSSQIDDILQLLEPKPTKIYNWGILGCGNISRKFAICLNAYPRAKRKAQTAHFFEL